MAAPGSIGFRNALLLLLTHAAGYVDAISYLALGRVFTANMTGNTVLLGLAVVQGDPRAAMRAGLAVGGFLAGAALGAWVVHRAPSPPLWPRGVTLALGLEWLLLAAMAAVPARASLDDPGVVGILIALASVAMGLQSAAARSLDVSGVATTFVTGTLTTLSTMMVTAPPSVSRGRRLLLGVWCLYVAGAVLGGAVAALAPGLAFAAPLALLLPVVAVAAAVFRR
jgi:uncharacterized membrane protein YoaK (UPF0700 family)